MIDKLSPVGLLNALLHGGAELLILFHQTQRRHLHQMLGIRTSMSGDLSQALQLVGREMNFHGAFRVKTGRRAVNRYRPAIKGERYATRGAWDWIRDNSGCAGLGEKDGRAVEERSTYLIYKGEYSSAGDDSMELWRVSF